MRMINEGTDEEIRRLSITRGKLEASSSRKQARQSPECTFKGT
ncbi:hypothetical protein [Anaerobacillus alkalidiazotrophicus]|nr:hypothetical protein [Anaerobacillus alkalidiazotrophicus]